MQKLSDFTKSLLRDNSSKTAYLFEAAYATTMCKAQGQTLNKAVLWFDIANISPETAYVALSRVKRQEDILFLNRLTPPFFTPVTRPTSLLQTHLPGSFSLHIRSIYSLKISPLQSLTNEKNSE